MKKLIMAASLALAGVMTAQAQEAPKAAQQAPASPAAEAKGTMLAVKYNSPRKKGRTIFAADGLVPYGKVWRTGANGTTRITFTHKVSFGGQVVEAGEYGLFTIPGANEWVVLLQKPYGANPFQFKEADAAVRIVAKPGKGAETENFTISVVAVKGGEHLVIQWDTVKVEVPVMKAE